jgi:hypothetical protein
MFNSGPPYDSSDELQERRLANDQNRYNNVNPFIDTQERVRFPPPGSDDLNPNLKNQVKIK